MRIYLETFGCTMNRGDTEIMLASLSDHEIVDSLEGAEVAVINSCGVIEHTARRVLKRIREAKARGARVIIAGCLPDIDPEAVAGADPHGILYPRGTDEIAEAVDVVGAGGRFLGSPALDSPKSNVPKLREDRNIATVPVAEGCVGRCSFCATRLARGRLKSFPPASICAEVANCVKNGAKELRLTAQDTGAYGLDSGTRLPRLLEEACKVKGEFRIRVGMMNPFSISDVIDPLLRAFENKKVFKFVHIPVQSGDNAILEHMNRRYRAEDFLDLVKKFRSHLGEITLSTDVIVGYPSEDEAAFLKTYNLIKEVRPDILNITRFSPRPGTLASNLKDMPDRYKKERSRKLTYLQERIGRENNAPFVGRKMKALITECGKGDTYLARTDSYHPVIVKEGTLGEFCKVEITDATSSYLIGR